MLPTLVIVLLCAVFLPLIASLSIWALCASRQPKQARTAKPPVLPSFHAQKRSAPMLFYLRDGLLVTTEKPASHAAFTLPTSWYPRLRTLVSLGFLLMVLLTLFVQRNLADETFQNLSRDFSFLNYSQYSSSDIHTSPHSTPGTPSQDLTRISQLDPNQYNSPAEYNSWAYSACSTAAMTEVFNAYGRHFRITDILKVEAQIGAITPQQGLIDPSGIQLTATQFGFKTTWGNSWTLDQVTTIANAGKPVIVSFPPDRYAGGHILVVIGGDSSNVYLADSSYWNRHSLTRGQFLQWWEGFAAVVTPT